MDCEEIRQCLNQFRWIDYSTLVATIAAVVAAVCAYFSYRLSKRIYEDIKSDEMIVTGRLHHPGLKEKEHDDCVLRCTLFNKSHRKAYIKNVEAFEQNGERIPITWSDAIDELGNIQNPTGLLGLENKVDLVLRRNDGKELKETSVHITHSFSNHVVELKFDPYQGWW